LTEKRETKRGEEKKSKEEGKKYCQTLSQNYLNS
jgi:hypothetical protein